MSASAFNIKHKGRAPYETIILARCPVDCKQCKVTYYKNKGRTMGFCCCRCHSHASPSSTQSEDYKEPEIGIGRLFTNE